MAKPDFNAMSGPDLVRMYNEMVITAVDLGLANHNKTVQRFADRDVGVKRCENLHSSIVAFRTGHAAADEQDDEDTAAIAEAAHAQEDEQEVAPASTTRVADGVADTTSAAPAAPEPQPAFRHTQRVAQPSEAELEDMAKKQTKKPARKKAEQTAPVKIGERLTNEHIVRLLVKGDNPKKPGTQSHRIWGKCRDGMTYGDLAAKACGGNRATARAWLQWHLDHQMVRVDKPKG